MIAPVQALANMVLWSLLGWMGWARIRMLAKRTGLPLGKPCPTALMFSRNAVRRFMNHAIAILIFLVWLTYLSCVGWQYHNHSMDDPMSDTGTAFGMMMIVVHGFVLALTATTILVCVWLSCWSLTVRVTDTPRTAGEPLRKP